MRRILLTLSGVVLAGGLALRAAGASTDRVDNSDIGFFKDAVEAGAAEVKLAQYAIDHATRADVKDFARMLVDEHAKANQELSSLASDKHVDVQPDPFGEGQAVYDRLAALSGPEYDVAYVKAALRAHERVVELFLEESITGLDSDAKSWATSALPTLERHLERARQLDAILDPIVVP